MRNLFIFITMFWIMASILKVEAAPNQIMPEEYHLNLYRAKVIDIKEIIEDTATSSKTQIVKIKIMNKDHKGFVTEVTNTMTGNTLYDIVLKKGMLISVHKEEWETGEVFFYVIGYERVNYVIQIIALFLICLIVIGGQKSIKAIVALSVTIFLILYVLIPLLLRGFSPIVISIAVCALATVITLSTIAGFNKKSLSAIIGTIGGLIIGGCIAYFYGVTAKLTGFNSAEAQMLMYLPERITFDYRGLLFCGIIIGALGAAMDVSISIASALTELLERDAKLSLSQIVRHGMNIGRDIMGTMANTLILAYTGASLTMLLIFIGFNKSVNEIINLDSVTTEIIRAIAGSIGLLFAIPLTAVTFALLSGKRFTNRDDIKEEKING